MVSIFHTPDKSYYGIAQFESASTRKWFLGHGQSNRLRIRAGIKYFAIIWGTCNAGTAWRLLTMKK